jgi:hypothetical protein
MRTILAILAALAIATTARAETEALVTDTNGGVISGRAGALEFTNDIRLVSVSGEGAQFIYTDDDGNIANAQSGPPDLFDNLKTSLALPSWATTTNASNARTNLGLGATNTPTFAGLTLTTLADTNGPNLVGSTTNGQLTNLSGVPAAGAPEGAVYTVVGGQYAGVASRMVPRILTNDVVKVNWAHPDTWQAGTNSETAFGTWSLDANSVYRVEYALLFQFFTNVSAYRHGLTFSGALATATNSVVGLGVLPAGAAITTISLATPTGGIELPRNTNATGQRFITGYLLVPTDSNAVTMSYHWTVNSSNSNAITLMRGSALSVTKIAP